MVEEPLDPAKPVEQSKSEQANPTAAPLVSDSSTAPSNETPGEKELRELNDALKKLCADAGISEEQLVAYMRAEKWMKPTHKRPSDLSTTMLKGFVKGWQGNVAEMTARIKKTNESK
jgi:hypothetical protein